MVRKSILVYDLLRTEQPPEGFSEREIVEQISNRHDITAGKGLRRQVAVALRRGIDFGIIAKKNNKFRFDPDNAIVNNARRRIKEKAKPKKKKRSEKKKKTTKSKKQRVNNSRSKTRKQSRSIPQPMMPKSWTPGKRNLAEEPIPKVKKI